jgi:hypothetical protein
MPMPINHILTPPFDEAYVSLGFLRALDRASRGRHQWPEAGVQQLLHILKKAGSLGDVCARFGLFATAEEERHVREDWFGQGGKGWWPKEPMEALFRKGMIRAIELLREHDVPLASYWRIGKTTRKAQITFAVSRHQLTLIISTPPPRVRTPQGRVIKNPNIWNITHTAANRIVAAAGRTPNPDDEPHVPPIPCLG